MEHLGYKFSNDADKLRRELASTNVCFMHAPLFHPALKAIGPVRRQLGVKTFFNILGPLVNPASPRYQASGVFSIEVGRVYSYLLQNEAKSFAVIHSLDGYDEVSLTSGVKLFSRKGEELLIPGHFGLSYATPADLSGGSTVEEAAKVFVDVLENRCPRPQKEVVLANSALAIRCFREDLGLQEAVDIARESIESGAALRAFRNLINMQ
jgi:anthranilate phosphoribosyltransferase